MDSLRIDHRPPLRRPLLIAAFTGWNDAGEAASAAVATLRRTLDATPFATMEPEEFYDFQVTRPTVQIVDGGTRELRWPEPTWSFASLPVGDESRDVVLFEAAEPNLRWRSFAATIVEFAQNLGVELVVTLGALQVDVPHTRPVPITANTTDPVLAGRLALRPSRYEGPTGIVGVLHHRCTEAGLAALSMWAGVPLYLAGAEYLPATVALLEQVTTVSGAELPIAEVVREAAAQQDEIAAAVAEDPELAAWIGELEERADSGPDDAHGLPAPPVSGDELAAELERYLRERRGD